MPVFQLTAETYERLSGKPSWIKEDYVDADGRKKKRFTLTNASIDMKASTPEGLEVWFNHLMECGRPAAIVKNVLGSLPVSYTVWVAGTRCQIEADSQGKHRLKYAAEGDKFKGEIVRSCHNFAAHIEGEE